MKAKLRRALARSTIDVKMINSRWHLTVNLEAGTDLVGAEGVRTLLLQELQDALDSTTAVRIRKAAAAVTDRLDLPDEIRDPVAETVRELLLRLDAVEEHDAMVDDKKRDGE